MLGVSEKKTILDRYNEAGENYSDETDGGDDALQEEIDAEGPVGHRQPDRDGDGRLGCPPDDVDVANLSGGERRRVALGRLLL